MSEDAKRSIQGALAMKPLSSDDRKPSSEAAAATPPTKKKKKKVGFVIFT